MSAFEIDHWTKSSYSSNSHSCVEVAITPGVVGVRDTKDRDGGMLVFEPQVWADFLAALKR